MNARWGQSRNPRPYAPRFARVGKPSFLSARVLYREGQFFRRLSQEKNMDWQEPQKNQSSSPRHLLEIRSPQVGQLMVSSIVNLP